MLRSRPLKLDYDLLQCRTATIVLHLSSPSLQFAQVERLQFAENR